MRISAIKEFDRDLCQSPLPKMRTFLIVCSGLHNLAGHEYQYTKAVLERLDRSEFAVRAWGRNDASSSVRAEPWFRPVFSRIPYDRMADPFVRRMRSLIQRETTWYKELKGSLEGELSHEGDIVFVHTFSMYSIWQWWRLQDMFEHRKVHLFLLFRYSPRTLPGYLKPLYCDFYRRLGVGYNYIHLLTDSEELREEYRQISPQPMHVLPIPIDAIWSSVGNTDAYANGNVVVGFPGSARVNKGFDLLPGAIERVNQSRFRDHLVFRIQCTPSGTDCLEAKCATAIQKLKSLQVQWKNIEFLEDHPSPEEYSELIRSLDIVLLPYIKGEYTTQTSGILAEALACGKQCVVPRDTWLARQVDEAAWGETFEAGNIEELASKTMKCIERCKRGERMAPDKLCAWRAHHNPASLVAVLRELAK